MEAWTATNFCKVRMRLKRIIARSLRRISAANTGPKRFHQKRTDSWLISIPRSCSKSSTFRSDSGNRTYIITARRMISGDVLKLRNGEGFVVRKRYETALPCSSQFLLTVPLKSLQRSVAEASFVTNLMGMQVGPCHAIKQYGKNQP